ncbi:hypothetical protein GOC59_18900 [Sinorhizobium medicae]|nr:hypothetical protein [Sinorhizobium medicae]
MSSDAQVIPEDIMRSAESALNEAVTEPLKVDAYVVIAKAILAERERCASVADYFSQACVCSEWTEEARGGGYYACADVASSIRNPSPPKQPSPPISDDDLPF